MSLQVEFKINLQSGEQSVQTLDELAMVLEHMAEVVRSLQGEGANLAAVDRHFKGLVSNPFLGDVGTIQVTNKT